MRNVRISLLLAALGAALAGCGDDDDDGTGADAAAGADSGAAADAALADAGGTDASTDDILVRLNAIPGMVATEQETMIEGYRFFWLEYDQPADHDTPAGQGFTQRMTLLHTSETAPMVMHSGGYYVSLQGRRAELTKLLGANQLSIEHRYFPPSQPDPADWSYMTIEQAAADFHRIRDAIHPIYESKWITTGASKGGMTAVFYRRFYPDDVDATVAYVAPILRDGPDERFVPFIAQAGSDEACRQALRDWQIAALTARDQIRPLIDADIAAEGWTFDRLGVDEAFEHAVGELPFYFWQYGDASLCPTIPAPGATAAEHYGFLGELSSMENVTDLVVGYYEPYFYQSGTQFGFPGFRQDHINDLLMYPDTDVPSSYGPAGAPMVYDPVPMNLVADWVANDAERIIFIYGSNDPWSAGMFELGPAVETYRFVVPDGNHGAHITELPEPDLSAAITTLEAWMGIDITLPMMKAARSAPISLDDGLRPPL
jgi:hypothetical protein